MSLLISDLSHEIIQYLFFLLPKPSKIFNITNHKISKFIYFIFVYKISISRFISNSQDNSDSEARERINEEFIKIKNVENDLKRRHSSNGESGNEPVS